MALFSSCAHSKRPSGYLHTEDGTHQTICEGVSEQAKTQTLSPFYVTHIEIKLICPVADDLVLRREVSYLVLVDLVASGCISIFVKEHRVSCDAWNWENHRASFHCHVFECFLVKCTFVFVCCRYLSVSGFAEQYQINTKTFLLKHRTTYY